MGRKRKGKPDVYQLYLENDLELTKRLANIRTRYKAETKKYLSMAKLMRVLLEIPLNQNSDEEIIEYLKNK